jgi:hypothetical protein
MKKLMLLVALMVATGTFKAYAQVVVYNFDAFPCPNTCASDLCNGVGTAAWSTLNTAVIATASNFSLGPGLSGLGSNPCGSMNGFSQGTPATGRARWANNWPTTATITSVTPDYFTFTLTTNPFNLVQINQITWQDRRSDSGPTLREVRTSFDAYATAFPVAVNTTTETWIPRAVSTGLPAFNGSIQIRIYGYGNIPPVGTSNGSLRIDNVRVFATVTLTNLPIELLSFTGEKVDESKVRLLWSTASERDNEYFTVYRSLDMQTWTEVGTAPGAGTSQSRIDYDLVDTSPHVGTNYYRLRQTDFDGTFVDSHVIAVDVDVGKTFAVFPNPVARGQPVQTSKKVDFIFDGLGKAVPFDSLSINIEIPGVYTLVHVDENGFSSASRVIVNP